MNKSNYIYDEEDVHERLDLWLVGQCPEHSRSQLQKLIKNGLVRVNGDTVKAGFMLTTRDEVEIEFPHDEPEPDYSEIEIPIIYEDDHIVVVDKPIGLVVHPGVQNQTGTLVQAFLSRGMSLSTLADSERPGIVHRLDKETSGIMVLAKSDLAYNSLISQFSNRLIDKFYLALANGIIKDAFVRIEAPLGRHAKHRPKMKVKMNGGKEAITDLALLDVIEDEMSLLLIKLITGRTHQIRVHLEAVGYSVVGDDVYGSNLERRSWSGRMMLHAWRLCLVHPETGEEMVFTSALPSEFAALTNLEILEDALEKFESR